jgi:hypothetical protein
MNIEKIKNNVYRFVGSSLEKDIYYFYKGNLSSHWFIKQGGDLLDMAKNKAEAIEICKSLVV